MTTTVSELVIKAARFAARAHAEAVQEDGSIGQLRKKTGEPYIVHPTEVARIISKVGGTDEMVAAGYLHDVVEDCGITHEEILSEFGEVVHSYVKWMTDVTTKADGNRATRMKIERERWEHAPAEAKTIKLADSISNTKDIAEHDPDFAKVYMREKTDAMHFLNGGNPDLYIQCLFQLKDYFIEVSYDQERIEKLDAMIRKILFGK